jgi:hypothetical protein
VERLCAALARCRQAVALLARRVVPPPAGCGARRGGELGRHRGALVWRCERAWGEQRRLAGARRVSTRSRPRRARARLRLVVRRAPGIRTASWRPCLGPKLGGAVGGRAERGESVSGGLGKDGCARHERAPWRGSGTAGREQRGLSECGRASRPGAGARALAGGARRGEPAGRALPSAWSERGAGPATSLGGCTRTAPAPSHEHRRLMHTRRTTGCSWRR